MNRPDRRAEAARHLAAIREQQLSIVRYAEFSGIPLRRLRYWRKRELREKRESVPLLFRPIDLPFNSASPYTLQIESCRLEIQRGFDPAEVMHLVAILRGA